MPTIALPLTGACRCGRVKIRATKPAFMTAACHCTGCQKMASSAFSLTAMFPADGFEVTEGETVIGGMHGDFLHHNFCAPLHELDVHAAGRARLRQCAAYDV